MSPSARCRASSRCRRPTARAEAASSSTVRAASSPMRTSSSRSARAARSRSFWVTDSAEARIVGTDQDDDLAVLQVADPQGLAPAQLGTSSGLRVGDQVLAIGSPLGLAGTVTAGIISATDRRAHRRGADPADDPDPDASINPGNSGGRW